MLDYALYRLHLDVVSPLHIGSGRDLLKEYDFVVHKGQTWRLNEDAVLEAQQMNAPSADDLALAKRLAQSRPGEMVDANKDLYPGSSFVRYAVRGTPRSRAEGAQVREQLKDVHDRPYVPGTTLKGALRTIIGRHGWTQTGQSLSKDFLGERREWAAQAYDRNIFTPPNTDSRRAPNYDLLRALHVADTRPLSPETLIVINANVLNRAGVTDSSSIPVEMEAFRANTHLECELKFDLALFSNWAKNNQLRLQGEEWLQALIAIARADNARQIQAEIDWFKGMQNAQRLLSAYQLFGSTHLESNQFFLQLGWGTGWDSKTYAVHLKRSAQFLEEIIRKYRLSRGTRQLGQPFPKSRRAIMSVTQANDGTRREVLSAPMGWVRVTVEPLRGQTQWLSLPTAGPLLAAPAAPAPAAAGVSAPEVQSSVDETGPTGLPEGAPASPVSAAPAPKPKPAPKPVIKSFSATPQIGDRFKGEVFEIRPKVVLLSVPGREDDEAYAVVSRDDLPSFLRLRDGDEWLLEVVAIEQETAKTARVVCEKVD